MYANKQIETIEREDLKILQLERLQKIISWAYEKSLFYKNHFDKAGVKPADIQTLDDLKKLPFLTVSEIYRTEATDFLTLPLSSIIRAEYADESSGEIIKFYTKGDVQNNVEMMTRCLVAADILRGSAVGLQGDLSDSKFLDILYALESIGATVIPLGTDYRKWLKILEMFSLDVLISTPQLAMQLIIQLQAVGKNIADYPIKKIICVNTGNIQNPLQQHIESRAAVEVYNLFAPAEFGCAGIIYQCSNESGHHVQEDNYIFEIVNFESGEVVNENDHMGELVVTTLTAQAMPLIRYRTRQAVKKVSGNCKCGRTLCRIANPYTRD